MVNAFYALAAPVWIWVCLYGLRTVKEWPNIMARRNEAKRDAAQIAGGMLDRLDKRIQFLEAAEEECRAELASAKGRIAELEGYNIGRGEAKQDAQRMLSAEREADKRGGK